MDATISGGRYAGLIEALSAVGSQPLWDRYHRLTRREPAAVDAPWHWTWADMEPLIERATREVAMEDAERRVPLLAHPAFPDSGAATTNLSSGLQTLLPGEVARAHRHNLQAIRFVIDGGGALTSVNNQRCAMAEGDLVLTPAWTWHEHVHPGSGRVVWFDGLDLPLCRYLDTVFLELAGPDRDLVEPPPTRAAALRKGAVALPPDAFDMRCESSSRWLASAICRRAVTAAPATRYAWWPRGRVAAGSATPPLPGSSATFLPRRTGTGSAIPHRKIC